MRFFLVVVYMLSAPAAVAFQELDQASGVGQQYTRGYDTRTLGEQFHRDEYLAVEGTPYTSIVQYDEAPESAIVPEGSEPKAGEAWLYSRSFRTSAVYDSNVDSTPTDPKDDMIYTYSGSFGMQKRQKTYYVQMFYNVAYSHQIEDEKEGNLSYSQTTAWGYKFDRITINLSNTITPQEKVAVGQRTELGDSSSTVQPISDNAHFDINYKVSPKTTASFLYDYSLEYFPEADNSAEAVAFGNQSHSFGPRVTYQVTPKTSVYVGYRWTTEDFFEDSKFREWTETLTLGIRGVINPKTSYSVDSGYKTRVYKDDEFGDSDGFSVRLGLFRKITPKIFGSIYARVDTTDASIDTESASVRQRLEHAYGANLTWRIRPKLSMFAEADVTFDMLEDSEETLADFENPSRFYTRSDENELYHWAVGLRWVPKRNLGFLLAYDYENSNSTFKNFEFEKHRVIASGELRF
jgi:hypothetical protein